MAHEDLKYTLEYLSKCGKSEVAYYEIYMDDARNLYEFILELVQETSGPGNSISSELFDKIKTVIPEKSNGFIDVSKIKQEVKSKK